MAKNIVIGVGNILFCDDGIGVIAAEYLKKNYSYAPELEILDGGTLGLNLIEYFLHYDNVFILDTLSMDEEAGNIYKIPSHELLGRGGYKSTAHEVEVVQMLEAAQLYDTKAQVSVFGIVAEDISRVQIGLSETLNTRFELFIQAVIEEVVELGIEVSKKEILTLEDIIKGFKCQS
ncbi:hydrogenase maturation protease [bacterium]|nr:hydrogenase maturation protease [bacterium]MBU1989431.1 hydrogenase maturation protease [bacterium]